MEPPAPESVEAAALDADVSLGPVDLRSARTELVQPGSVSKIRTQSSYMDAPVLDAFDGLLVVPTVTAEHPPGL